MSPVSLQCHVTITLEYYLIFPVPEMLFAAYTFESLYSYVEDSERADRQRILLYIFFFKDQRHLPEEKHFSLSEAFVNTQISLFKCYTVLICSLVSLF